MRITSSQFEELLYLTVPRIQHFGITVCKVISVSVWWEMMCSIHTHFVCIADTFYRDMAQASWFLYSGLNTFYKFPDSILCTYAQYYNTIVQNTTVPDFILGLNLDQNSEALLSFTTIEMLQKKIAYLLN